MGIEYKTAYPYKYRTTQLSNMESGEKRRTRKAVRPVGKLQISFEVKGTVLSQTRIQRELAEIIGRTIKVKPVYHKYYLDSTSRGYYVVRDWMVNGLQVKSRHFDLSEMPRYLAVIEAICNLRLSPEGDICISFCPNRQNADVVLNLWTILEARRVLIEKALGLQGGLKIILHKHEMALGFEPGVFSIPQIEACLCLINQIGRMSDNTGKARMKPSDGTNPKYEMRTWLLRLGFIGEMFERPRRTLLSGLEGDMAFFSDDSKARMIAKKKAKELNH